LSDVLGALCQIAETQAGTSARAAILLTDEPGERLFVGGTSNLPSELHAAWSMPILSSSGSPLGSFTTYFPELREPTAEERQLVEVLAQTASLAVERARADAALQAGARRDRFLAELAAATQPLSTPGELMETTARLLALHLGASRCAYAEVEHEDTFVITGDYGPTVPSIVGRWPVAAFGPACVRDMLEGRAYVVTDTDSHPAISAEHLPAYRATNIRAVICVPLHKQGRLTAAMALHQDEPRSWLQEEIELVSLVVARSWEALERARVTRTLQESEARYRAMVDASPDCVTLIAADGKLLQINPAGLSMLEADHESAVLGSSIYELITPAHRAAFERLNERVCRGERGTLELELVGKRGGRRWMELSAVPLSLTKDAQRAHLAIARDMTARMEAESALAQSRARVDYAVELSGVGFWYCDLPFDELSWDERVKAHFFFPPDARITIDDFYAQLHPEDRESTRTAIERSIETRTPYDVVYRTQCPVTLDIKWIRALGGTTYDADGQPCRFDGVTLDVTTLRRTHERLEELLVGEQEKGRERAHLVAQLREQERRKDEFLATLAHELRNPLAALRFGLELLDRSNGPEVSARAHATMERQLTHLVRMVDDLLEASRITLGKVALQTERLDFRVVLQSAIETARPLLDSNGQKLDVYVPDEPLPIDGDPTRLSQVLANLLNNAAKYTPSGGRIEVRVSTQGPDLQATVSDNGTGIPPDMLEKVFDMFTQIERTMKHARGGLGLGLTLVRKLLELHGGSVVATSAGLGQGSTFTLRLPLAEARKSAELVSASQVVSTRSTLRVLVVDDNEDAAECLASLLDLEGHRTHLAHSGPDAVTSARAFTPDVILLDIGLPGFDGYEVARRLHQELGERMPRLVAVTGFGADSDKRRSQEAGFDAHLVKPISTALLMRELAAAASDI
jgi:PAS domain S-box-containing protein